MPRSGRTPLLPPSNPDRPHARPSGRLSPIRKPGVAMAKAVATTKQRPPSPSSAQHKPLMSQPSSRVFLRLFACIQSSFAALRLTQHRLPAGYAQVFSSSFCLDLSANRRHHQQRCFRTSVPGSLYHGSTNCCTAYTVLARLRTDLHSRSICLLKEKSPLSQSQPLDCSKYSFRVILVAPSQADAVPFAQPSLKACCQQSHNVVT